MGFRSHSYVEDISTDRLFMCSGWLSPKIARLGNVYYKTVTMFLETKRFIERVSTLPYHIA